MNHYSYLFLALDIANQRSKEAERRWLEATMVPSGPSFGTRLRRLTARALAAVSRAFASAVGRLDECVADDLGRTLASAE